MACITTKSNNGTTNLLAPDHTDLNAICQYILSSRCAKITTLPKDKNGNHITIITAKEFGNNKWNLAMQKCIYRSFIFINGIYYGGIAKFFNCYEAFDRKTIVFYSMKSIFNSKKTVKLFYQKKANGQNASFFVKDSHFYFCQKNGIVTADSKYALREIDTRFTHAVEVGFIFFEYYDKLSSEKQSELFEFLKNCRVFCEKIYPEKHQHPVTDLKESRHLEVFSITTIGPEGKEYSPDVVESLCLHFGMQYVGKYPSSSIKSKSIASIDELFESVDAIYNDPIFSEGSVIVITDEDNNIIGRLKAKNKRYCMLRKLREDIVGRKNIFCINEIVKRFGEVTDDFYNLLVNIYLIAREYSDVKAQFAVIRTRAESVPIKSRSELQKIMTELPKKSCTLVVYGNLIIGMGKSYLTEKIGSHFKCSTISKDRLEKEGYKGKRLKNRLTKELVDAFKSHDIAVLDRSHPTNSFDSLKKIINEIEIKTGKSVKIVCIQLPHTSKTRNLFIVAMYNLITRKDHPILATDTIEKQIFCIRLYFAFIKINSHCNYSDEFENNFSNTTVISYNPVKDIPILSDTELNNFYDLSKKVCSMFPKLEHKSNAFVLPKCENNNITYYHQLITVINSLYGILKTRLYGNVYKEIDMEMFKIAFDSAKITNTTITKWAGYSICNCEQFKEIFSRIEMNILDTLIDKIKNKKEFHVTGQVNFDRKNKQNMETFLENAPEFLTCTLLNIAYVPEDSSLVCITVKLSEEIIGIKDNLHITVCCGADTQAVESNYLIETLLELGIIMYSEKINIKLDDVTSWGKNGNPGTILISDELYGVKFEMKKHYY